MTIYSALLFDLDDTLLDFQAAERAALAGVFRQLSLPLRPDLDAVQRQYKTINEALWRDHENGTVSVEEIFASRFPRLFTALGLDADGLEAEALYRQGLNEDATLMPDALAVLTRLAPHYELHLISNGKPDTQRQRLARSGLERFFGKLFISQEIGSPKPEPAFFQAVFDALPELAPGEMLAIGDSITADICGAKNAGIDSCWLNRHGTTPPPGITPTYQIDALPALLDILHVKDHPEEYL